MRDSARLSVFVLKFTLKEKLIIFSARSLNRHNIKLGYYESVQRDFFSVGAKA